MKNLFEASVVAEIKERLDHLTPETQAVWGKMNVNQMLAHCQFPLKIALGEENYNLKPNFLAKLLFKKSLYNDKPWRKGLPTPAVFRVSDAKDHDVEKQRLTTLIDQFYALRGVKDLPAHPAFGYFTKTQWGQMQYKHLDHHLKQFGA